MTPRGGISVLLLLFFLSLPMQEALAGARLVSHRAYYSTAIGEVSRTSPIVDANAPL